MVDLDSDQGRNRPATTSEKRISAAFCVIVAVLLLWWMVGCTVIDEHKAPPADFPKLEITVKETGFAETQDKCGWSVAGALLIGPIYGCAIIYFEKMTCEIYLWWSAVLDHERMHCRGYDHIGSSKIADGWENWKKANGK